MYIIRQTLKMKETTTNFIIGSCAIKHWFPDFKREPKDLDVIGDDVPFTTLRIERHDNPVFLEYCTDNELIILSFSKFHDDRYPTPDALYTLKCSHLFWPINQQKHIDDVRFLQDKGCTLIEPLFAQLYDYWTKVHGVRKTPNFSSTSEEFFDNFIECPIDHETLHCHFAWYDKPLYHRILKDGCEVEIDEEKFNQLSEIDQQRVVMEECGNLAFERWRDKPAKVGYYRALNRMILALTPLWLAKYIISNYNKLSPTQKFYETWNKLKNSLNNTHQNN